VFGVSVVDAFSVVEVIVPLEKALKIRLVLFCLSKIDLYNLTYLYVTIYVLSLIFLFIALYVPC
jgi:hypothetical protein